jgi:hypothetical protein
LRLAAVELLFRTCRRNYFCLKVKKAVMFILLINYFICQKIGKGKGKTEPIAGHEGPEREYRYNSTLSLTSALNGEYIQRDTPHAKLPGETEIGWATRTVWTGAGNLAPNRDSIT